jgi:uncharacterized protein YcaQ
LTDLQANFNILPVAISQAGRWHYAFVYDITTRHFPDLIDRTRLISERKARLKLTELYLRSVGATQLSQLRKLFGWSSGDIEHTLDELDKSGLVHSHLARADQAGEWISLTSLTD